MERNEAGEVVFGEQGRSQGPIHACDQVEPNGGIYVFEWLSFLEEKVCVPVYIWNTDMYVYSHTHTYNYTSMCYYFLRLLYVT